MSERKNLVKTVLPKMDDYITSQNLIDQIYKFYDISKWRNNFQDLSFLNYCAC